MKIVCSWCGKLVGYKCPFCGEPLQSAPAFPEYMVCHEALSSIYYAIANMATTHTMCEACRAEHINLSPEDQANLAALDGAGNRGEGPRKEEKK